MSPDIGLPEPDLVLFLDIDPDVARLRGGFGEERYEKEEMQKRVRMLFNRLGGEMGEKWETVDAGRTLEDVANDIWAKVKPFTSTIDHNLGQLWIK